MAIRFSSVLIAGVACVTAVSTAAHAAGEWVSVAKTDRTEVFANPASIGISPASWVIVATRQNFTEPQPAAKKGKSFLSARNEYRVDCATRRLAYREIDAYAQPGLQGERVQKTKIGEKNLKWMDAPTGTVFGEILDYACSRAPAAPVPAPGS
jgi:hypothetical protein